MNKIKINDNIFNCKIVASPHERSRGMMGKRFNNTFNGMIFLQGLDDHCFWMKNCIIPLDIIFIKDNVITKIHHNCPPCEDDICDERYCGEGDLVLEIAGNSCDELDINEGDKIDFMF
jgi:uncharacterized membrane protein (UPF0127 family)